ncbi:MAG: LLM class F420-dependent oxidoreductase [Actinomycetota bacterium]
MKLRVFTEPQQGASYADLLAVAQAAETAGFDAFFRSDHFQKMGTHVSGLPGPSDAWITLAGIARETTTIRLGTLVNSATFRLPGVLAIAVANVDEMSGGRVELGLGAGWYADEHRSYGIPFPGLGERFAILAEQLEIITGLWSTPEGGSFTHRGHHFTIEDSPALPKPVQSPIPVIVGGGGPTKTPMLAARHAAEFNLPFQSPERFNEQKARVTAACESIGRDPATMTWSCAQVVCVGKNDAEIARRAATIGREPDELRKNGLCGTPAEVVEKLLAWSATGADRVYLQVLDLADLDHVAFIGEEVLPFV